MDVNYLGAIPTSLSANAPERQLDDGYVHAAPVGALRANPFGLHDVIGTVDEWTLCEPFRYEPPYTPRSGDGRPWSQVGAGAPTVGALAALLLDQRSHADRAPGAVCCPPATGITGAGREAHATT